MTVDTVNYYTVCYKFNYHIPRMTFCHLVRFTGPQLKKAISLAPPGLGKLKIHSSNKNNKNICALYLVNKLQTHYIRNSDLRINDHQLLYGVK